MEDLIILIFLFVCLYVGKAKVPSRIAVHTHTHMHAISNPCIYLFTYASYNLCDNIKTHSKKVLENARARRQTIHCPRFALQRYCFFISLPRVVGNLSHSLIYCTESKALE